MNIGIKQSQPVFRAHAYQQNGDASAEIASKVLQKPFEL